MTEETTLTPIEAINEFYRLKDKYENGYYEKYVKPIIRSNKSKRDMAARGSSVTPARVTRPAKSGRLMRASISDL